MRFTLFDRWGTQLRTVAGVSSAEWVEELNGEDTLTIVTTDPLEKGQRVVWCDQQGAWHEHIVASVAMEHAGGEPTYTATCENSIAELYGDWVADKRPSGSAALAVRAALETSRWTVGTVDVEGSHSASLYRTSAREALQTVVETWGGELSTTIAVSGTQVTSRRVNLTRRGTDNGRRFAYGRDMMSVSRTVDADDVVTALYGFGKGEEVGDGYGRGIDFADVNGGKQYVEDLEALETWGRPDGSGGKAHVFGKFEASGCDDPEELLELTRAELDRRKEPKVSYEASVETFADYGYDFSGVALGDDVALVDTAGSVSFRAKGRVTRLARNLLDGGRATDITIGNVVEGLDGMLSQQYADLRGLVERATGWDVAAYTPSPYIQQIMDGLNREFDSGASYVYQSPEQGLIVASVPLDPETGRPLSTPASAIQLKGGGFRIADSLAGDGGWDWRTFGTGSGFVADYIVAGNLRADLITTGTISDRAGSNYWDLDSGEFRLAATATVGGQTVGDIAQGAADGALSDAKDYADELDRSLDQAEVFNRLTNGGAVQGITMSDGQLYVNADYIATGVLTDRAGRNYWNMETGEFSLSASSTVGGQTVTDIAEGAASGALSEAVAHADEAAGSALDSANAYTDALDQSLDQAEVFDRLTDGGAEQGIYLQGGRLYVNGTYIASGVIDAGLVRAGRIADSAGRNYWDLETGEFSLSSSATVGGETVQGIANSAANGALVSAKGYADSAAAGALSSAKSYADGIDDSFTQSKIFNRLTNNGQTQGIYLSGGRVYINASYISTGTLSANLIKAGTIADKAGKSSWNLATGDLSLNGSITVGSTSSYNIRLTGGYFYMYNGGTRVSQMYANGANAVTWNMSGKTLNLTAKNISAVDSDLGSGGSAYTTSLSCPICTKVVNNGNGTVTANNGSVLFASNLGLVSVMSWPGATER